MASALLSCLAEVPRRETALTGRGGGHHGKTPRAAACCERFHQIIEHELLDRTFIFAFWLGSTAFTMASHLVLSSLN